MTSSSVIRILPRKKIERHVVKYSSVLSWVLTRRFLQVGTVIILAIVLTSPVVALFIPRVSSKAFALTSISSTSPVLFRSKLSLVPERPAFSSVASELVQTICSRNFIGTLIAYALSATIYFEGILSKNLTLYNLQKAQFNENPQGVPASSASHQTDKWYVVHENFSYIYGFTYFATCVMSLLQMKTYALEIDSRENGMKPFNRLIFRSRKSSRTLVVWAVSTTVWPVLYRLSARNVVVSISTVNLSGTQVFSGFRFDNLSLPCKVLPLILLWEFCQEAFMAYMSLGPTLKGRPISEFARFDKNGTLVNGLAQNLNGLSARFAWHELLSIAEHVERRRIDIFKDVDGERAIWDSISADFEKLIKSQVGALKKSSNDKNSHKKELKPQNHSVTHFEVDSSSTAQILSSAESKLAGNAASKRMVPLEEKKVPVSLDSANVFKPESASEKKSASFVSSLESRSTTRVEHAQQRSKRYRESIHKKLIETYEVFSQMRLGKPFLQTVDRKLAFEIPHRQTTSFAVRGIARMITQSLKEDQNGYVQGTIAQTLFLLDEYATRLETVIKTPPIDAHDVRVKRHETKPDSTHAEKMLAEVNCAFIEIVEVFEPYFDNLGVTSNVRERSKRARSGKSTVAETAWIA